MTLMNSSIKTKPAEMINQGLPSLETNSKKTTSYFEFWPIQLIYLPVVFQWLYLSLRYRSLSLPLIANPSIHLAGMVGESKSSVLELAGKQAKKHIAPYINMLNDQSQSIDLRVSNALNRMQQSLLIFPVIAKPDLGCRGAGVKIIRNETALKNYIQDFPDQAIFLIQHKVPHEAEAGIFYIRQPEKKQGEIFSITLKYTPYVIGDGLKTLAQLIKSDARASKISELYFKRHLNLLNTVIPDNQAFRLSFAGTHCKGSIFRNGNSYISEELTAVFDNITADIKDFYYGRFDVRFESIEKLIQGKDFSILEINGASSEATHIWDRNTKLGEVYKTLFYQYNTLFRIGDINRKNGHKTPPIWHLLKAWREENKLVKQYPETD